MKKIFALFALMLVCIGQMFAYDFEVDGIYYNKSGSNATVTYKTSSYNSYSGIVIIPATVTYDGVTYSVTSIGSFAFDSCSGLTSITIPSSVTSIGSQAFWGCRGLTSVTIPKGVTSIGANGFYDCTGLISITIPNSVTSIGDRAFYGCTGLTSITIPSSVTSIGADAFYGCTSLPVIDNIRYADCWAVEATDKSLASYSFKEGTRSIGNSAFNNCTALTSITIPSSVEIIEIAAFTNCTGLTSVTIPNSVTSIRDGIFRGCDGLTSIIVASGNTKYDSRDNCNGIIETATNTLIQGCNNTIIPSSVTSIGSYAFTNNKGLTSITIPSSVTKIGAFAFYGCTGLISITIPNGVTTLSNYCFYNCKGLKSITFPESLQYLGQSLLGSCKNVSIVRVRSRSMPTTATTNFGSMSGATLYVPANLVEQYKATDPWKKFGTILPFYEGELVDGTSYNSSTNSEILDLSYTRTFTSTNWQALYVPFSMKYDDWKDKLDVYDIYNVLAYDEDNNGEIERTTVNMIRLKEGAVTEPNYPYVVRAKNAGDVEITLTDGTLYAAEENSIDCTSTKQKFTFTGTYESMTGLYTKGCYALDGGVLKTAIDDAVTLKPQRWYMEVTNRNGSPAAATRVYLNPFGEENEVEGVKGVAVNVIGEETTYDLNGRTVNAAQLPEGLYVRGGKKIIVK